MCGIAGWIDFTKNKDDFSDTAYTMCETFKQRGPDADGIYKDENVSFAHRRLSVIDLEGGKQPFEITLADKTYVITYNGELYNTDELRNTLKNKGYHFRSYSDTEVILVAYIEWQDSCVEYLNGIFAFAIWDKYNKRLFAARDRFGVKPFFYKVLDNGSFIFASEIKGILAHPNVNCEVDTSGLLQVLFLGPARHYGNAVFKDIKELLPGNALIYNQNGLKINTYFKLSAYEHTDNFIDTVEKVKYLVTDSIKRQLVSDVPLCTFLSGGLDSSCITAVAAECYKQKNIQLDTYSLDFVDNDINFVPSRFQPDTDDKWAKLVSEHFHTNHTKIVFDTPELIEHLKTALFARDLPGMTDIDSSLYLFCREIKKKSTVGLSGECADEIFGGYPWFYQEDLLYVDTFPWANSIRERASLLNNNILNGIDASEYVREVYLECKNNAPKLPGDTIKNNRIREMTYLNINYFMANLLERKDRMTSYCGLEARVPFCDHRIVEYAYNIPMDFKLYLGREKGLLRQALTNILPPDVLWRKKSPYPKTYHPLYLKTMKELLQTELNENGAALRRIFNIPKLEELINSDAQLFQKPFYGQLMKGPQILAYFVQLSMWLREYKIHIL